MLNLYSIHDRKAKSFSPPFVSPNHEDATRKVRASLTPDSMLTKFSEDYALVHSGYFNDELGTVSPLESFSPELVCQISALVGGA